MDVDQVARTVGIANRLPIGSFGNAFVGTSAEIRVREATVEGSADESVLQSTPAANLEID